METGNVTPDRINAMIYALHNEAESARELSLRVGNEYLGAALRGKVRAHREAIRMLECLLFGEALPMPRRARRARMQRIAERKAGLS